MSKEMPTLSVDIPLDTLSDHTDTLLALETLSSACMRACIDGPKVIVEKIEVFKVRVNEEKVILETTFRDPWNSDGKSTSEYSGYISELSEYDLIGAGKVGKAILLRIGATLMQSKSRFELRNTAFMQSVQDLYHEWRKASA